MHKGLNLDQASVVLEQGCEYPVASSLEPSEQIRLTCIGAQQRNWSRVGVGQILAPQEAESGQVFLKQNIDRGGYRQHRHWSYEQAGAVIARDLLGDVVEVPALLYQNEALLINVFEYIDIITVDELLRSDPAAFKERFTDVMERMVQVLERMRAPRAGALGEGLPIKARPYGGPSTAINFKGFEIRNAGFAKAAGGSVDTDSLVMFDFVRPYLGPIEEAAAKLFVSIGLLNWGKPLHRFMRGPDMSLLEQSLQLLCPFLDRQAIEAEIELQYRFRTHEFQGSGHLERSFKKAGIDLLGKRYLHRFAHWCELHVR